MNEAKAVRRTLRLSVLEGMLVQAFLNWTTGSVIIGYMLHLGASATELSLIASVPMLAQLASPFAAYLAGKTGRLKGVMALTAFIGRFLWILTALLPLLGVPAALQPTFIVLLFMVSSLFQASTATLWSSWIGSVVPESQRGRYFGFRAGVVGVFGMVANLGAGWFLDQVSAPLGFQVVLGVGVLSSVLAALTLVWHFEPPVTRAPPRLKAIFRSPWQDANFRKFLTFGVYWQASVLISAPFVFTYFLEQLKMSFTKIAIWSVIASLSALFTTSLWGRIADRYGNKVVLAIGTTIAGSAMPLSWMLASENHLWPIWFSAFFDAAAWGPLARRFSTWRSRARPKKTAPPLSLCTPLPLGVPDLSAGSCPGRCWSSLVSSSPLSWALPGRVFIASSCSPASCSCKPGAFYARFGRRTPGAPVTCSGWFASAGAGAAFTGADLGLRYKLIS